MACIDRTANGLSSSNFGVPVRRSLSQKIHRDTNRSGRQEGGDGNVVADKKIQKQM